MRVKRVIIGVVAGMAVLAAGVWFLIRSLGEHEHLYEGKPIYYWEDRMNSSDAAASNETRLVLEKEVIPRLCDVMFHDTQDSKLKCALIDQFNNLPGVTIYYTPAEGRRGQAAGSLGSFGSHAQAAVPDLIKAVKAKDEAVRIAAVTALGQIKYQSDEVIPLLILCLDDSQDGVPVAAVESLGNFGALSRPAWPKLIPLLKLRDKDMRRVLPIALKQIDPDEAANAGIK